MNANVEKYMVKNSSLYVASDESLVEKIGEHF